MVRNYAMDSNATRTQTSPSMSETPSLPPSPLPGLAITPEASGTLGEAAFVALIGAIVEHSPWVARRAWRQGPFATWMALFQAMADCIHGAPHAEQLALLRVHPELAGREAVAGIMTPDSSAEQGRLGLMALDVRTMERLLEMNRAYRERFGYPFVVALRLHASLDSVFQDGARRIAHSPEAELPVALQQVCEVMRGRLAAVALLAAAATTAEPHSHATLPESHS